MSTPKPITFAAAGIAAVVIAFGAYALGSSNSDQGTSGTANATAAGQVSGDSQLPQNGQARPGFGTPVAGAEADKAEAAALAKYKGTAERVMKLDDGSYVVHVITSNSEYHVSVSKNFEVTGAQQGGPGRGGAPGISLGTAPQGGSGGSSNTTS
jgi:hypothetical protein